MLKPAPGCVSHLQETSVSRTELLLQPEERVTRQKARLHLQLGDPEYRQIYGVFIIHKNELFIQPGVSTPFKRYVSSIGRSSTARRKKL